MPDGQSIFVTDQLCGIGVEVVVEYSRCREQCS
jgi:hypothetical protein